MEIKLDSVVTPLTAGELRESDRSSLFTKAATLDISPTTKVVPPVVPPSGHITITTPDGKSVTLPEKEAGRRVAEASELGSMFEVKSDDKVGLLLKTFFGRYDLQPRSAIGKGHWFIIYDKKKESFIQDQTAPRKGTYMKFRDTDDLVRWLITNGKI